MGLDRRLIAVHVILVALSVDVTVILSVEIRMFCVSFTSTVNMINPLSLWSSICCPLASQAKLFATPVQLNSATTLPIETLTALGGIVISVCTEILRRGYSD